MSNEFPETVSKIRLLRASAAVLVARLAVCLPLTEDLTSPTTFGKKAKPA